MRFWLISFVLMFITAEGLDWLGSLEWLKAVDISLPFLAAGGLGLAIASNARHSDSGPSIPPAPPAAPTPIETAPAEKASPASVSPSPSPVAKPAPKSISFEIPKRRRYE